MKNSQTAYCPYKNKPVSVNRKKPELTTDEQRIMQIREKYKPKLPSKKPICPQVLVERFRPENIKINNHIIEEEAFGLKPFKENEIEELFYLKGQKKRDSISLNLKISQPEAEKMLHDLNFLESFKNQARVTDLIHDRKLSQMWKRLR